MAAPLADLPTLDPGATAATWLNLVLPGGGLVLLGEIGGGLLVGLLFTACTGFALLSTLLFPDDYPRAVTVLGIGLAAGSYVGAQVRLSQALRRQAAAQAARRRASQLRLACECLQRGDPAGALAALEPLVDSARTDLLVAYRLAQALSAAGDDAGAAAAWEQVRALDRHGLFKRMANCE